MSSTFQANLESMTTRNKSALKKQFNDQNEKTLNELLMRPNITIKKTLLFKKYNDEQTNMNNIGPPKSIITSRNNSGNIVKNKKAQTRSLLNSENIEYYPDKHRRNVRLKKIALQPKHAYKVVAITNKRKRRTPHKGCTESISALPKIEYDPELTMEELVRIADEQGIDDEDFMEILTCPSPVWWEEMGDKEEIRIRFHEDSMNDDSNITSSIKIDYHVSNDAKDETMLNDKTAKSLKTDINFFKRFVEKRSKLEKVLGNIKFKKKPDKRVRSLNISNESSISDGSSIVTRTIRDTVRADSVGGLFDAGINEDLLNTLENIDIPVEVNTETEAADLDDESDTINKGSNKLNDKPNELNDESNKLNDKSNKLNDESNKLNDESNANDVSGFNMIEIHNLRSLDNSDESHSGNKSQRKQTGKSQRRTKRKKMEKKICDEEVENDVEPVPTNLPTLTKNPFIIKSKPYESPKSMESVTSETNSSAIELDSISDTNIKFLDEYDSDKTQRNDPEKNLIDNAKRDAELVTVYKIITNKNDEVDIEEQIKTNRVNKLLIDQPNEISSFYKNRKRRLITNTCLAELNKLEKKRLHTQKIREAMQKRNREKSRSKKVPKTKFKYCHECTSIFETDSCQYCIKKNSLEKNNCMRGKNIN